jgi:hypothetical protein
MRSADRLDRGDFPKNEKHRRRSFIEEQFYYLSSCLKMRSQLSSSLSTAPKNLQEEPS